MISYPLTKRTTDSPTFQNTPKNMVILPLLMNIKAIDPHSIENIETILVLTEITLPMTFKICGLIPLKKAHTEEGQCHTVVSKFYDALKEYF